MGINCENVSNRGNGDNCKISPRDPQTNFYQQCEFNKGNGLNGGVKVLQAEMLCKKLHNCYAKKHNRDYWETVIVPQVQKKLRCLEKQIEREKTKKPP